MLDKPRDPQITAISPPFITETAKQMGMPTDGTLSAAENARVYLEVAMGRRTGTVICPEAP